MNSFLILESPVCADDIQTIEVLNEKNQLIISPYDPSILNPYKISSYLFQSIGLNQKIYSVLDSNLTVELCKISKTLRCNTPSAKNAIILLAFLHLADVDLEPGISIAEYSTTCKNPDSYKRIYNLRRLDNLPIAYLVDIALGRIKNIDLKKTLYKKELAKFKEYKEPFDVQHWPMFYTFAMKIFLIANSQKNKKEKIASFISWMWKDYLFSAVAFTFACVFFSERFGKMLKGVHSRNKNKMVKGIKNAAWDMTIVNYWSRKVVERYDHKTHYIFCTADMALQEVARLLLDQTGFLSREKWINQLLSTFLMKKDVNDLILLYDKYSNAIDDPSRKINSYPNSKEYFQEYINRLEKQVIDIAQQNASPDRYSAAAFGLAP